MSSLKEIQEFIEQVSKLNINKIELKTEELKLIIEKKIDNAIQKTVISKIEEPKEQEVKIIEPKKEIKEEKEINNEDIFNTIIIKSPMVGTFYRRPKPDQSPYVEIGTKIKKGDIICIIEAMKLFNEIESEYNGEIIKIYTEEGSPVEYDQPLFEIKIL